MVEEKTANSILGHSEEMCPKCGQKTPSSRWMKPIEPAGLRWLARKHSETFSIDEVDMLMFSAEAWERWIKMTKEAVQKQSFSFCVECNTRISIGEIHALVHEGDVSKTYCTPCYYEIYPVE